MLPKRIESDILFYVVFLWIKVCVYLWQNMIQFCLDIFSISLYKQR